MSHLTVTEKEHWKERISRRIDKAIEAVYAEDTSLKSRIADAARSESLKSLGLAELQQQLDKIEQNEKRLSKQKEAIHRKMLAIVKGVAVDDVRSYSYYSSRPHEVAEAVNRRHGIHEEELLARDPNGNRVLKLRQEKDELLDTVWLATSSKQIKQLWQSVAALVSQEPTELQAEALRIDPVEPAE
jgi:hypothetical protein